MNRNETSPLTREKKAFFQALKGIYVRYEDARGNMIRVQCYLARHGYVFIPKEGFTASEMMLLGYDMVLLERGNARELIWLDTEEGLCYRLYADDLPENTF